MGSLLTNELKCFSQHFCARSDHPLDKRLLSMLVSDSNSVSVTFDATCPSVMVNTRSTMFKSFSSTSRSRLSTCPRVRSMTAVVLPKWSRRGRAMWRSPYAIVLTLSDESAHRNKYSLQSTKQRQWAILSVCLCVRAYVYGELNAFLGATLPCKAENPSASAVAQKQKEYSLLFEEVEKIQPVTKLLTYFVRSSCPPCCQANTNRTPSVTAISFLYRLCLSNFQFFKSREISPAHRVFVRTGRPLAILLDLYLKERRRRMRKFWLPITWKDSPSEWEAFDVWLWQDPARSLPASFSVHSHRLHSADTISGKVENAEFKIAMQKNQTMTSLFWS